MSLHSIGYLFREGLKSLWKNRTMSIASIGVLIACLLMTGVAALLTLNISATMQSVEGNNVITVYLSSDVPALTAVRIGEEIDKVIGGFAHGAHAVRRGQRSDVRKHAAGAFEHTFLPPINMQLL